MTQAPPAADPVAIAPGSVVVVRDEEWYVRATEETADGLLVHVQGLGELVRDTTASFYAALDDIVAFDPAQATVVADPSPRYRTARLWLESTIRKTPVPLGEATLSVSGQALATPLVYQQAAVRRALDPDNLRPRILLADTVGLGKTLEIGMILAELVRRGRGERILVVTPRHVLEQMQHELWTRFALPFVRLDSSGIQSVRQKLPATRNPFTFYKRAIISIDTVKSDRYHAGLRAQRWDAVVIDESHNLSNSATLNNRLARLLSRTTEALILASATPHNGRADSFAELIRLLDPSAVAPDGALRPDEVARLVVRRHRHSPEVASVVGADWAQRAQPRHLLVASTAAEDAVATELDQVWLFPTSGRSPYSGKNAGLFPWTLAKEFLSSPAALTLRWLHQHLPADLGLGPGAVEIMHGGLPDDAQQDLIAAFKKAQSPVRVLVTGDVASEGVSLHLQCHHLIHFDIPWSLIRIEQRNGRIDRYGQKHPRRSPHCCWTRRAPGSPATCVSSPR